MMHHAPRRRAGLATLEFVLALPFLLLALCAILATGFLGTGRILVGAQARQQAWQQRTQATGGRPLQLAPPDTPVERTAQRPIHFLPGLHLNLTAESQHAVLGGTWDYRTVRPGEEPAATAGNMAQSFGASSAADLFSLTSLLPFGSDVAQSSGQAADILGQIQDQRQKVQQEVEAARQKLAVVQQQVQKLSQQRDQLDQKLKQLQDQRKQALNLKDMVKRKQALMRIDAQLTAARNQRTQTVQALTQDQKQLQGLQAAVAAGRIVP